MSTPSSRTEAESIVHSWGSPHVFTWTDSASSHYPAHSHSGLTTHLILHGQLTITYPGSDADGKKETYGPGARIDVPAGKMHEVWIGKEGCTYVIGE